MHTRHWNDPVFAFRLQLVQSPSRLCRSRYRLTRSSCVIPNHPLSFYVFFPQHQAPAQLKATHYTMSINRDLPLRVRRIADNHTQVVLTLRTGAEEVFEHGWRDFPSHIGKVAREDFILLPFRFPFPRQLLGLSDLRGSHLLG